MQISGIHHVSLLVQDTRRALDFYCGLLGLDLVDRPEMRFPGAWLALGTLQLHLLALPHPADGIDRPEHVGRDQHLALKIDDLDALKQKLDQAGIAYTLSRSGRRALFCRDPDDNGLEFVAN